MMMTLDDIRVHIDTIDEQMKDLFLKRMECSRKVAEIKAESCGDVFVPERERAIIEKRTQDSGEFYDEYVAFLRHLMSVSRRYQYGILTELQKKVLSENLKKAGADDTQKHRQVEIAFRCKKSDSNLNLYLDMVKLNGIRIDKMHLSAENEVQKVWMILDGNIKESNMCRLLCQLGKETEDFAIIALR